MNALRRHHSARGCALFCFATAIGILTFCSAAPLVAASPVKSASVADAPVPPDPPILQIAPAPLSTAKMPVVSTLTIKATKPVPCSRLRASDQIWLISTRQLGCGICLDGDPALQFWRLENNCWQTADLKTFLAADDPHTPTDVFIHGNDKTAEEANDQGFTVYNRLVGVAPVDRPMRFVIWSWPTDPGRHPVQLVRSHACRADADAWYLGWLLSRIDRRVPIGLIGYSFGARVTTGAIHLMGGGELLGSSLKLDPKAGRPMVRAVLLAAAEDEGWLGPGAPNRMTIPTADRMLMINNFCDSTLKHYPLLDRCTHAAALGYVGLATSDPKIEQCDACNAVGTEHYWLNYFCNDCLVAKMRPYLFLADMPANSNASAVAKSVDKASAKLASKP